MTRPPALPFHGAVPVKDLLKLPVVVTSARADVVKGLTADFVRRRVRRLVDLDGSLADPGHPGDITAAGTTAVATKLATELPKVRAAHTEIWKRVRDDEQQLDLSMDRIRKSVSTRPPAKDPRVMRRLLVATIVFQGAAVDIALADPAGVDRLHALCDRRLRIVERMLYDVGRADHGDWSRSQIEAHRGGPWVDGLVRMFEYPRVPQSVFLAPCRADPTTNVCQAPMADWKVSGSEHLLGPTRTNPDTRASWRANGYGQNFDKAGPLKTVAAIQKLFTPSTDYLGRNLLFCDHTIHALHLEALVFAVQKRLVDLPGRDDWLDQELDKKLPIFPNWLRLYLPLGGSATYLAGPLEPAHFEHLSVREADLQPGDHLIVYNHPAYQHSTIDGVWRLENAIVVQSHPALRMQGHGSRVYDKGGMWQAMVTLFNRELARRRADIDGLTKVATGGPSSPNRFKVQSLDRLRVGMQIELADPTTDLAVVTNRKVTALDHKASTVTYDGAPATAAPGQIVRRARAVVNGFEQVVGLPVNGALRRRVPAAGSSYSGRHRRADWYLTWTDSGDDTGINDVRKDPAKLAFVREHQLVDLEVDAAAGEPHTRGWFPLWRPTLRRGQPVRNADGKISATEPVVVEPDHVAGWTWFLDPDPTKRDRVPVLRPRET
jgi:hypothetical protein